MSDRTSTVRLVRAFDAAPEPLFDAWLDPTVARFWLFATPDGQMGRVEIDPRVEGVFTIVERRADEDVAHTGTYLHVERPYRLAFSFAVPALSEVRTIVSVAIMQVAVTSILSLSHEGVPAAMAERTEEGWSSMLDRLAVTLERRAAPVGDSERGMPRNRTRDRTSEDPA